jgi:hypothetical protein
VTTVLQPPVFVWCIAGPHIDETLVDIVNRKRRDIERFGWCLWAYGGTGNAHPETEIRRLANGYVERQALQLLMPDTGTKYPDNGVPFTGYQHGRSDESVGIPDGMSPVTGGQSSWAFWITSLDWSDDTVVDVAGYTAPYARRGPQVLPDYLEGSHGRACAARGAAAGGGLEGRVHIVAELVEPYAVFLSR